jgi:hypothetical protein
VKKIMAQVKKEHVVGGFKIVATFELEDLGQGAYFAATADTWEQNPGNHHWYEASCGMLHDKIIRYFPKYEKYLKWHLCHLDRGPWYYFENSLFWAGKKGQYKDTPNAKHFKSTIVYGAAEGDDVPAEEITNEFLEAATEEEIRAVLEERHPAMMSAFYRDMDELFGAGTVYKVMNS